MPDTPPISAVLAIDALPMDARTAFDLAADTGFRGIAFATSHSELEPARLGQSGRRHVRSILAAKGLTLESLRIAAPRGALADPAAIDRTMDIARQAILLARHLGIRTVTLPVGAIVRTSVPEATLVAALRELSQNADAADVTLALSADNAASLRGLLKQVDCRRTCANLDPARLIAAGQDPLYAAEELAGVIAQLTAADATRADRTVCAAPLGEGQTPLNALIDILRQQAFNGPIVVDPRDLPDAATGARHAAAVLRHLLRRGTS